MMRNRGRISELLIAALLAVLLSACEEQTKETAILLTVKSGMGVTSEMDKITLEVINARTGLTVSGVEHKPLGSNPTSTRRVVWRVAVVAGTIGNYPDGVELVVKGLKDQVVVASTGAFKEFRQDAVMRQTVNLDLARHVPLIISTVPEDGATNVDTGTAISVTFNEPMEPGPALAGGSGFDGIEEMAEFHDSSGGTVEGALSASPDMTTFSFMPSEMLEADETYSALLRARNDDGEAFLVGTVSGEPMARTYAMSFSTGSFLQVTDTVPGDGAVGVAQDQVISVTFDRDVVSGTVNTGSLLVTDDLGAVVGSVAYDDSGSRTASFTPARPLRELIEHTVAVTTGVEAEDGTTLSEDTLFRFTTTSDPPGVASTRPVDDAVDVALNTAIAVTFDEAMAAASFDGAFSVRQNGGAALTGDVSYDVGTYTVTFAPDALLEAGASVTVTVAGTVTDASGIALGGDYSFDFTVGDGPGVVSTDPEEGATGVSLLAKISAEFTREMNPASLNSGTFLVTCDGAVTGVVSYQAASRTAVFDPGSPLPEFRNCEATLTTGVQDSSGVPLLAEYRWSFQTAGMAPEVVATDPADRAFEVSIKSRTVTIEFSEPLDPATVTGENISVTDHGGSWGGATKWVGGANNAVTVTFAENLEPGRLYFVEVGSGVTDLAGLSLPAPYTGAFWTRVAPAIAYTLPENLSVDVPTNSLVVVGFSVPMNQATFALTTNPDSPESVTVIHEDIILESGTLTYYAAPRAVVFQPQGELARHTRYTVVLDGSMITDDEGTALGGTQSFSFVTGGGQDQEAPFVVDTDPPHEAGDVDLDKVAFVSFNEAMEPLTITAANISIAPSDSGVPIGATVRYVGGNLAMIIPDDLLDPGETYVLKVTDRVRDASGNRMAAEVQSLFYTEDPDTQPPGLAGTMPESGAVGVPTNQAVALLFDEPVDGATVAISALAGTAPVSGTVRTGLYNRVVIFEPDTGWPESKHITVFVAPGLADLEGNANPDELTACYFDVGSALDNEGPYITTSIPADGATEVAPGTFVVLNLSEQLDLGSFDLYEIKIEERVGGARVPYYLSYDPAEPRIDILIEGRLSGGTTYDVTVPTAARDMAGNPIQDGPGLNRISFTVDSSRPQVLETSPAGGGVSGPGAALVARFSEAIDGSTLDMVAFHVRPRGTSIDDLIPGAVSYSAATRTAVLQPAFSLDPGEYEAWILTRVTDLAGNSLLGNQTEGYRWYFSVASSGLWVVDIDPGPGDLLGIDEFEKPVRVTFNKPVKEDSLFGNFWVEQEGGAPVAGTVSYEVTEQTAVFSLPEGAAWEDAMTYFVTVGSEVESFDGQDSLESSFTSDFTTITIVFSDDMEQGDTGWLEPMLSINTWKIVEDRGLEEGGEHVWATRGRDDGSERYNRPCGVVQPPDDKVTLSSPEIVIPERLKTVYLLFTHRYHIEDSDFAQVAVDPIGVAQPRELVAPFNGNNNKYEWVSVEMSSLLGAGDLGGDRSIRLEFTLNVDGQRSGVQGNCDPTYLGWQIDNIVVFGY